MARSRNIKPGFFRNADLVELPVEARLLFIGLWTIADREGRLEDRPKQIKMELFPADNFDCNAHLDALAAIGMIQRYEASGSRFICVTNFSKHQNPHCKEPQSVIPPPESSDEDHDDIRCKSGASPVQAPCNDGSETVQAGLIPDSGFLIPDSGFLIPEKTPAPPAVDDAQKTTKRKAAGAADRFDAADFLVQNGVEPQTAADYLTLRKAKRAPATRTAMQDIIREAGKTTWSAQEVITKCCQAGWSGFKAAWIADQQARAGPRLTRDEERKRTLDELTGRTKHGKPQQQNERDITAEVIRIA